MNRRGFMGALAASGLIPFLPKPEEEGWPRQNAMTDELVDDAVLYSNVSDTTDGGIMVTEEFHVEFDHAIAYETYIMPDGSRVRVPRLEGARAVYHG